MEDMQSKMNAILGNPEMMQQIMNMAQSLGQSQPQPQQHPPEQEAAPMPDIDLSTIQKLASFAGQSNVDSNQRTLLRALTPYLSQDRVVKLEKAMRAAKMANLASAFLSKSGFQFNPGR